MKKTLLTAIAAMMSMGIYATTDSDEACPVYYSFTDKVVTTDNVKWDDTESVTAFLKANVSDIPDGYTFRNYRTNTDIMGYTHHDCRQVDTAAGAEMPNRELIVHTDASGKVLYITGDLWAQASTLAKSSAAKGMSNTGSQQQKVIIIVNGKERLCYVDIKNFNRVYTDAETGEVVLSESLIASIDKATEPVKLTGNAYYEDTEFMINPDITGALQNGKYILQDPDRKIYTIDYTTHIVEQNAAAAGLTPLTDFTKLATNGELDEALAYGNNFSSSTADFGAEHNTLTSRLSLVTINNSMEDYDLPVDEFKFEIRKCNDNDVEWAEATEYGGMSLRGDLNQAWDNGTTVATSTATSDGRNIAFNFDVEFTTPSMERDPDYANNIYHDVYIGALRYGNEVSSVMLMGDRNQDDFLGESYIWCNDKRYNFTTSLQRDFVKVQPALDIHWGMERTMDIYKEHYGINSFNNQGSPVIAFVNLGLISGIGMPSNACALPYGNDKFGSMAFGMGGRGMDEVDAGRGRYYPVANISTIGHEFTHLVATKIAGRGERAALNESYADIMGKKVERYALIPHYYMSGDCEVNTVSWGNAPMIHFSIPQKPSRCFYDPNEYENPKYYKGKYWDKRSFNPESHNNAGVQNYWFYLLCTGGDITPEKGDPVSITAIPRDSAELIAFSSLMYFATPLLNYSMARKNSIHAAEMYFGKNSQEVETVLRAWYAVGVGTDEWQPGDPTAIETISSTDNVATATTARKLLKNGRLVIQKNGRTYTAAGQEL